MKKLLLIFCISILPVQAFQDCIISTDGKLSDISIEHNDIIDVYPLFTIMNEKNILFIHPLKVGRSKFCVLKNGKQKVLFNVNVEEELTKIDDVEGFDIISIDVPPQIGDDNSLEDMYLDFPPQLRK